MRILDRYVIREVLLPFFIGLLVFTFILIIPFLIQYAEAFIAKGVPTPVVLRVMVTLLPQALALSIPAALLVGLLIAFGRLSADREFVAMQACGVSIARLLWPVGLISLAGWAATSYVMLEALPDANQAFREITFNVLAARAEGEVKPRIFFESFPDLVIYVRDVPPTGGWDDVFMADSRPGQPPAIYLARRGRVILNAQKRTVEMELQDATRHVADASGTYKVATFTRLLLSVNPESIFPRTGPQKGDPEMTIFELQERAGELEGLGQSSHNELMAIHRKFAIPIACLVFGVIGLALGATNRRDGKLGSFVYGLGVIFAYYIPLNLGPALAKGRPDGALAGRLASKHHPERVRRRAVLLALAQLGPGIPLHDARLPQRTKPARVIAPRVETGMSLLRRVGWRGMFRIPASSIAMSRRCMPTCSRSAPSGCSASSTCRPLSTGRTRCSRARRRGPCSAIISGISRRSMSISCCR